MTSAVPARRRAAPPAGGLHAFAATAMILAGLLPGGLPASAHDLTPWMGRPATERKHFQGNQFARAGNPQCISPLAMPAESPHEVSYYAGGGARTKAWRGEERRETEGIWGVDYGGILFPKHVDLGWWHGSRYQGGYGAYRTDGPRIVHKP
jgi:hypothetical protein